ncbi:MAG TPA: helix-turn-helix domain-containing protein [Ktedonobacteraceae bacterium]
MEPITLSTTLQAYPFDNSTCPVARTARIISGKWTLLIIRDLAAGVKRFNQLERSLQGISPKTLSERLRSLEEEGVILRQTFAEVPPRVEYSLTEKGHDLVALVTCMRCYGNRWLCDAVAPEQPATPAL